MFSYRLYAPGHIFPVTSPHLTIKKVVLMNHNFTIDLQYELAASADIPMCCEIIEITPTVEHLNVQLAMSSDGPFYK